MTARNTFAGDGQAFNTRRSNSRPRLPFNPTFDLVTHCLIMLLLTGSCPSLFAQSQTAADENAIQQAPAHFTRVHGSHKIMIHPNIQMDGIRTGIVMAYGHIIPPPYKLKYTEAGLLVNGVQVAPSMILAKEPRLRAHPSTALEKIDYEKGARVVRQARELYSKEIQVKSLDTVQADVLNLINKSTDVYVNPKWIGKDSLRVSFAGSRIQDLLQFSASPANQPSAAETHQREIEGSRRAEDLILRGLQKNLEANNFVAFVSDGTRVVMKDPRNAIIQIMGTPGLTKKQKAEMIYTGITNDYDFALDVTENFNAAEWRTK